MVVSRLQFCSFNQKCMFGFCLVTLLPSCGRQIASHAQEHTLDDFAKVNGTVATGEDANIESKDEKGQTILYNGLLSMQYLLSYFNKKGQKQVHSTPGFAIDALACNVRKALENANNKGWNNIYS